MKKHSMMLVMLLGSLQLIFTPVFAANKDDHQPLHALLDEFMLGASSNDRATHERFWADDLIYTSSSGVLFGKQHILDGMAASAGSAEPTAQYRATEVNIRLLRDDIAVITFVLVADLPDQTRQRYLNTGLFEHNNGEWRASVWQATEAAAQ